MIISTKGSIFDFQSTRFVHIDSPGCRLERGKKLRRFKMYFNKINRTLKLR